MNYKLHRVSLRLITGTLHLILFLHHVILNGSSCQWNWRKQIMAKEGNVKHCPIVKDTWEARAIEIDCGGLNSYHCLTDNEGRKWERCVEKALIKEGNCPIFSSKGFIDWKPCNISMSTCPNTSYVSDEVYRYPGCFGNNSIHERSVEDQQKSNGISDGLIIGVVLCILFILILAVALIVVYAYRRRKHSNLHTQEELAENSRT